MTPKKLASIIIIIAGSLLVAFILQALGDKTHQASTQEQNTHQAASSAEEVDQIQADLAGAIDDSSFQTTVLATLRGTPNPQKISAAEKDVAKAQAGVATANQDAYAYSKDAVQKTAVTFKNDQIKGIHDDMLDTINAWKAHVVSGNVPSPDAVNGYLASLQKDLAELQSIIASLTKDNSELTQAQIDSYKVAVDGAISEINTAIKNITDAQVQEKTAEQTLALQNSIGDPVAIQNQTNKVLDAEAKVAALKDELAKIEASNPPPVYTPFQQSDNGTPPINPNLKIAPLYDPTKPQLIQN